MVDSEEDDDSYVYLGEWIGPVSSDEPAKKPVSVHDLEVRDSQGRVRFHGAFTGGFSAGYFNTVGSKEGWAPSTFVSSRERRPKQKSAVPEDFMDDEDFGEHGIAPRQIVTSDNFKSEALQKKRRAMASAITSESLLSGLESTLLDLIVPEKLSIGVRLLRKMGWKEGQGVGPRYKKHKKKKNSDDVIIYGCTLPDSDSESEAFDDFAPESVTFAPKDTCPISFVPKDNNHGLGYSGINIKAVLPEPFSAPTQLKSHKRKGIHGMAFGVGALEEDGDDDDIYHMDSLSNYDQSIGGPEFDDDLFGWTAPGKNKPGTHLPTSYVGKMLDGFTLAANSSPRRKIYHLPAIPKGYKPFHIFKEIPCDLKTSVPDQKRQPLNAHSRSILLGEINTEGSVFDLLMKDDADRLTKFSEINQKSETPENQVSNHDCQSQSVSVVEQIPPPPPPSTADSSTSQKESSIVAVEPKPDAIIKEPDKIAIKPFKIQGTQLPQTSNSLQTGFQPFVIDPAKQERYDRYLLLLKHGKIDPYDDVSAGCEMTEWERTKEKEEFSHAAKIFKPLSGFMATRFTAAKFTDDDDSAKMPIDDSADKNDLSRAAEMKLFGKLTRETFEWHPDQLLCRRFNVPDPHPGSGIIGIPKLKRDKYSVFNFLEAAQFRNLPTSNKQLEKTKVSDACTESTNTKSASSTESSKDKPSIFSHLMEPSVTESKQALHSVKAEKGSQSNILPTTSVTKVELTTDIKDGERPPVDLFKAIFADSSSSEDEENEQEKENNDKLQPVSKAKSSNENPFSISMTIGNSTKDLSHPSDKDPNLKPCPEISAKSKFWDCVLTSEKEETSHTTTEQQQQHSPLARHEQKESMSDEEVYGPALPPSLTLTKGHEDKSTSLLDNQLLSILKNHSSKKHKNKNRHKSKKSKKVKHKHKEKRHKKKKKHSSSSKRRESSRSSSASSSSSSSISPPVHKKKKRVM